MEKEPKEALLARFDREDVLVRNANIDTTILAEHDRLVQDLKRAGAGLKRSQSRYTLEHPLGGDRMRFSNWAERMSSRKR